MYTLCLDKNFVPFLEATWHKKTASNSHRGLNKDSTSVPEASRLTAVQKKTYLDLLRQIATFCPVISRNSIVNNSTSLNNICQTVCQHYAFNQPGPTFLTWLTSLSNQMRGLRTYTSTSLHSLMTIC